VSIRPGKTIGILGGGQLGRMMAMAARSLGYGVHALDPDPACAARGVVDQCLAARFDDELAAAWFARGCDVVTLEIEKVSTAVLEAASRYAPVRPGVAILETVQDRGRQRAWLSKHGFPLGPWRHATSQAEIDASVRMLGGRCFVKACHGGYDGRGQVEVDGSADGAWDALGGAPVVVEQALDLEAELSVMVARRPGGETVVFPPALNHHENRILAWSVMPAPLPREILDSAVEIARGIAENFQLEGVLAIEMFLVRDGRLLVNELAPRPHNSFHATERACLTSQFEQAVRAACDLPLGSTALVQPTAIVNLLGEVWLGSSPPDFAAALALPGTRLHLYGKSEARKGRKMGHLSAVGESPEHAVAAARRALAALEGTVTGA
jgi:5-(carboxyamino)imidazole ribonucleotide synthase